MTRLHAQNVLLVVAALNLGISLASSAWGDGAFALTGVFVAGLIFGAMVREAGDG